MTEEEVLNGVYELGRAHMWVDEGDECRACYKRTKDGFVRLLREDHAKSVEVTKSLLYQTMRGGELIAELRALWERVKVFLPDETLSYDAATILGGGLEMKGQFEESKVLWLAALEGKRRILEGEDKRTLASLNNIGKRPSPNGGLRSGALLLPTSA